MAQRRIVIDLSQPRGVSEDMFIEGPERLGPNKGFVVKPDRHKTTTELGERQQVVIERWPNVLRANVHTCLDLLHTGAHIWLVPHLDEAVGAVASTTQHSPRAMIFE